MEKRIEAAKNPCSTCHAPKVIKNTMYCSVDQLYNALQDFKQAVSMGKLHACYQCRCADLIRCYKENKHEHK